MKSTNYQEDILEAKNAFGKLKSEIKDVYQYELPLDMGKRVILRIYKKGETSSLYPRTFAQIKKNHL
jgi:hypothetical protein